MDKKQKAQELFDKYFLLTAHAMDEKYGWVAVALNKSLAKQCALIAVDEIINSVDNEHVSDIFNDYWEEVKQEIEKL